MSADSLDRPMPQVHTLAADSSSTVEAAVRPQAQPAGTGSTTGSTYGPVFMHEVLAQLSTDDAVLDLGCGNGSFPYSRYAHLRISAVDIAPPEKQLPGNVQFRLGRAEDLPFDNSAFKLVIAHYVLEHVADFGQALQEIERVLEPHGQLCMAVPDARSFEDQLYRVLFAGGGHLQQPTLEWIIRETYRHTSLKLVSYADWPAAMVYFDESDEMRAFTYAVMNTAERITGCNLWARSNYVLLFRKEETLGYRRVDRACTYCGEGDPVAHDRTSPRPAAANDPLAPAMEGHRVDWRCPHCGRVNKLRVAPSAVEGPRLKTDLERFEQRYGGRLKRAVPVPDPASASSGVNWGVPTSPGAIPNGPAPLTALELHELRWLAKWSHWFRSHLRFYNFLRRLKRAVAR